MRHVLARRPRSMPPGRVMLRAPRTSSSCRACTPYDGEPLLRVVEVDLLVQHAERVDLRHHRQRLQRPLDQIGEVVELAGRCICRRRRRPVARLCRAGSRMTMPARRRDGVPDDREARSPMNCSHVRAQLARRCGRRTSTPTKPLPATAARRVATPSAAAPRRRSARPFDGGRRRPTRAAPSTIVTRGRPWSSPARHVSIA